MEIKKELKYSDFINFLQKNNSHVKSYPRIECIYKIKNVLNGYFYIGYTNDFFKRSKSHANSNKLFIDREISFFGVSNFTFEIIYDFKKDEKIKNESKYKYKIFIEHFFIKNLNPKYNEYKL